MNSDLRHTASRLIRVNLVSAVPPGMTYTVPEGTWISAHELLILEKMAREYGADSVEYMAALFFTGVIILHEYAHWGDSQDGVNSSVEDGYGFEKEAYGRIINNFNDAVEFVKNYAKQHNIKYREVSY